MPERKPRAKTDQELLRQLERAAASSEPIEAVFRLQPASGSQKFVPPEEVEPLTRELLARVEQKLGMGVKDLNIFRNLGSFVVSAGAPFLRELLEQPEIAAAVANRQPSSPK